MSGYFASLVAISAIVGISSYVSYGEGRDPVVKCALALILVYVISVPTINLVREIGEMDFYNGVFDGAEIKVEDTAFGENAERAFADGICKFVSEEFSVPQSEVRVVVYGFDAKNMRAKKIKVILSSSAALADGRLICQKVTECGLGECEVEIDFG